MRFPTRPYPTVPALSAAALLFAACGGADLDCAAVGLVQDGGTCVPGADAGDFDADAGSDDAGAEGGCADAGCEDASAPAPDATMEPPDEDDDGVEDAEDNCRAHANPDQEDLDGDDVGDACDPDRDGDGIENDADSCPNDADGEALDLDGDGLGDACDPDADGDGVDDEADACPMGITGTDFDGDGCEDASEDDDDDGDGVPDADDHCPLRAASTRDDPDGDGCPASEDACPSGGYRGADTDGDGCLDIEDPSPESPEVPGVPAIIHVDADVADDSGDGQSWERAFRYLQDALRAANAQADSGERVEVWIGRGTYHPDDSLDDPALADDHLASFRPRTGVALVGGFVERERGWERTALEETVLSGDIGQDDAGGIVGRNACHVVGGVAAGVPYAEELILDGLVVEAGSTQQALNADCSTTTGGMLASEYRGGGIATAGPATLRHVVVRGNVAGTGAAIFAERLELLQSRIAANLGSDGTAISTTRLRAHGTEIVGNRGSEDTPLSFAAVLASADAVLVNSVIAGNQTGVNAYGTAVAILGDAAFLHVTLVGNDDLDGVAGVLTRAGYSGEATLTHVLAQGNSRWLRSVENAGWQIFERSLVQGLFSSTPGILEPDPYLRDESGSSIFVKPVVHTSAPDANGNLRLRLSATNQAIDAGSSTLPQCPTGTDFARDWSRMALPDGTPICADGLLQVDADGNPRLQGDAVDLGAYELAQ